MMREILESEIAVISYTTDEFRLINGDCYVSAPFATTGRAQRKESRSFYKKVPLSQTEGECLRYPSFWLSLKNDPEVKTEVDRIKSTPFPLHYQLPRGVSERDITEEERADYIMGRGEAKEYTYPYPIDIRVDGAEILDGIHAAQEWLQSTLDHVIKTRTKCVIWRIRPESDIRLCGDGRFMAKVYMRFALSDTIDEADIEIKELAHG